MPYGAIRISVSYRPRAAAIRLATAYAQGFARFKIAVQARAARKGMARIDSILRDMRARGKAGTGRYRDTVSSRRDNAILAAQFARHGQFARGAKGATSLRPHVLRNGLVGGALGALVGIALAVGFAARRGRGG
jgi:hypothetical protein